MTIQSSGPISFSDFQTEFSGSNPISISEYYRNLGSVPRKVTSNNTGIPTSGAISASQFYGGSRDGTYDSLTAQTSSGTFSAASDAAYYHVLVVGGGGGGAATIASSGTLSANWRGGARGAHSINSTDTVLSGSYTVTVGSGGAGGFTTEQLVLGSSGGTSSVSGTNLSMTASGGAGNGSGSTAGQNASITTTSPDNYAAYSGTGGTYTGPNQGITGGNGTNYGAGGGAIYNNNYDSGPSATGGSGSQGVVVFYKYVYA
jgi:hypothetical protein